MSIEYRLIIDLKKWYFSVIGGINAGVCLKNQASHKSVWLDFPTYNLIRINWWLLDSVWQSTADLIWNSPNWKSSKLNVCHINSNGFARNWQRYICRKDGTEWENISNSTSLRKEFWLFSTLEWEHLEAPSWYERNIPCLP